MKITPTGDLLVVRRIEDPAPTTDWGFVLPQGEDHVETPYLGEVLFAGDGKVAKLTGAGKAVIDALDAVLENHPSPDAEVCLAAKNALEAHHAIPERIPMQVKAGDKVVFSRNGFQEFKVNGETVVVMGEASIMGVIED